MSGATASDLPRSKSFELQTFEACSPTFEAASMSESWAAASMARKTTSLYSSFGWADHLHGGGFLCWGPFLHLYSGYAQSYSWTDSDQLYWIALELSSHRRPEFWAEHEGYSNLEAKTVSLGIEHKFWLQHGFNVSGEDTSGWNCNSSRRGSNFALGLSF